MQGPGNLGYGASPHYALMLPVDYRNTFPSAHVLHRCRYDPEQVATFTHTIP